MGAFSFLLIHSTLLCCFLLSIRFSTANILGNETDRLALLAFKSQITQDPQNILSSWNDSHHFCNWGGVVCSHRHVRVTVLDLTSKGLSGSISPYIGNLSFMRTLNLQNNSFHGSLPQELGRLSRLEDLAMINNSLVGEIPTNISLCTNLVNLFLSGNRLAGKIPMELGSLSKLVQLALENDKLTGEIPPSLGNLTSLTALALSYNSLQGTIPSTLGQLQRLQILSLAANKLSGMLPPLSNLSTLRVLSIPGNRLAGIFPKQFSLPNLNYFLIGGNRFSGPIPVFLFNASKLWKIDISINQFTGEVPLNLGNLKELQFLALQENDLGSGKSGDLDFFTPLTNCTTLQNIVIYSNRFGGVLPTSVGNFSDQLVSLYLSENQISGNIPTQLENLRNLILLDLDSNSFTGNIPIGLQNLQKLQVLYLSGNKLSGRVPSFLTNMSQLYDIQMSNNILEGSIASALESQNVQLLDLSHNKFSGTIPKAIGLLSQLQQLNLRKNSLNGSIPLEVGNLKTLQHLDVSENNMSGEIPAALGSCSSLEYIHFENNFFQGHLPSSLTSLKGLHYMDVSSNNLSGIIPKELENLSVLTNLNISFNDFEGEVPVEGVFLNATAFSVLGNDKICGGIRKLGLPQCHIQRLKKKGLGLALKLTLGLIIPLFIVGLFLTVYLRRKPKVTLPNEQCMGDLKRVSYNDLYKATDGFSPEKLIGKGSYGSVYKGILDTDESLIAVKVLNLMEHGASKTFMAECEALREVRHRNLVKILTVCSSVNFNGEDFKALVYEFMPNGSLESWLHPNLDEQHVPKNLNLYQRLDVAIDVASAIDYLHNDCEIAIAHCDLKSSNVLLNQDLTAHVGDFGLAKFLPKTSITSASNTNESSSIAIRGTIGYIPPEYGTGADVSTQGDVYSYGILLLEMFTGRRPTDQMFHQGLSLHEYSKIALSHQVMDAIDARLLSGVTHNNDAIATNQVKECLSSIMRIGVACSVDLMTDRMTIKDVLKDLKSIERKNWQVEAHD